MRNRIRKTPSGSMAVAFTALLIALGGTAAALPGSNTVTTGDIKRGAVRTSDIKNNNVRGTDVRTSTLRGSDVAANTLTGSDINESSLGTVPSASNAGVANAAGAAVRANSAASVDGVVISGQAKANYGAAPVLIARSGGWSLELVCEDDASVVNLENVAAGEDAHSFSGGTFESDVDLDQGDSQVVVGNPPPGAPGEQVFRGSVGAQGPSGGAVTVFATLSEDPDDSFAGADCVASGQLLGS